MKFHVLPAERSDMHTLSEISRQAFATNPEFHLMFRNCNDDMMKKGHAMSFVQNFNVPGRKYFKAVDENGFTVGMSHWWFQHTLTPEQKAAGLRVDLLPEIWPEGAQAELCKEFLGRLFESRKRMLDSEKVYPLNTLAVWPEFQRMGAGGLLLEYWFKFVDKAGSGSYLQASSKGSGLYLKYGWKEVDSIQYDLRPYGGEGMGETKLMFREPQKEIE